MGSDDMDVANHREWGCPVLRSHTLSFHCASQDWFACAARKDRDLEHCMMTSSGLRGQLASAVLFPPTLP